MRRGEATMSKRDTGVVCKKRSCRVVLTRAAVEGGSDYCSADCAGLGFRVVHAGVVDDAPDVSDADLLEVETA